MYLVQLESNLNQTSPLAWPPPAVESQAILRPVRHARGGSASEGGGDNTNPPNISTFLTATTAECRQHRGDARITRSGLCVWARCATD